MNKKSIGRKIFINALWLIREEQYWTRDFCAIDADGYSVLVDDPRAICYCSIGALYKTTKNTDEYKVYHHKMLDQFRDYLYKNRKNEIFSDLFDNYHLDNYNDKHTYQEVIDLWINVGISKDYLPEGFTMDQLETLRNSL